MRRRPIAIPAGIGLALVVGLAIAAWRYPVVRPMVERFVILTIAGTIVTLIVMAVARALPEPAATDLDPVRVSLPEPGTLPRELRRVATTFDRSAGVGGWRGQHVGGRSHIHRLGRERLLARGLDPQDPAHADAIRSLTGEHLWVLVSTPLDRPVRHIDVDVAIARLEAL